MAWAAGIELMTPLSALGVALLARVCEGWNQTHARSRVPGAQPLARVPELVGAARALLPGVRMIALRWFFSPLTIHEASLRVARLTALGMDKITSLACEVRRSSRALGPELYTHRTARVLAYRLARRWVCAQAQARFETLGGEPLQQVAWAGEAMRVRKIPPAQLATILVLHPGSGSDHTSVGRDLAQRSLAEALECACPALVHLLERSADPSRVSAYIATSTRQRDWDTTKGAPCDL